MSIHFQAKPFKINSWIILHLPQEASVKLPSRGIAMVKGNLNDTKFQTVLEPDGKRGHWFKMDQSLIKASKTNVGEVLKLVIEPTKEWIEPEIPDDITKALSANPKAHAVWMDITPMARWEWLRWIRATSVLETRQKRIEVACSKLKSGMRRPCCFNANMCTVPEVSKSGVLLEPPN
jgi:hypothetical protein